MNEPNADASRSILDGHIVLSRRLATANHYPSIEVLESISRVEPAILTREQRDMTSEIRRMLAAYREAKDLIEIGAYITGSNALVDRAVRQKEQIDQFLCQDITEITRCVESWAALSEVLATDDVPETVSA
jgi:flagellum-specific ATP synthase